MSEKAQLSGENYENEPVRYTQFEVVDLAVEGAAVTEDYRNMVINQINDHACGLSFLTSSTVGITTRTAMSFSSSSKAVW